MMALRPLRWLALTTFALAACGDDASTDGSGGGADSSSTTSTTSGAGGAENTAPSWEDAPAAPLSLGQGATIRIPFTVADAEGDVVTPTFTPPAGVDAVVEGAELVIHAGYDLEGPSSMAVSLADGRGGATELTVSLEVSPLAWSETFEWGLGEGPEAREHATVLVDDDGGSIYVMFGSGYSPYLEPLGDAWRFDVATETWSECTLAGDVPAPGGSRRIGGRRGSGEGWLYGGYGEDNVAFDEVFHVVADGDVLTFEELEQENPPGRRVLHVFAFDPGTETFAMFGGVTLGLEGDTWTMKVEDGVAVWTELAPAAAPSKRYGAFFGMDEELGRLTLFSGQTSQTEFGQDTWILDLRAEGGPTWTEVTPPGSPAGRRNGTSAWDPMGPRLFVFGGTSDGATSQPGLFAFDARPGHESWTEIVREGQPPMRSSGFAGATEDGVWLGFGNDDGVYRDFTRLGH